MLGKIILSLIVIGLIIVSFRQGFKLGAEMGIKRGSLVITCHPAFSAKDLDKVGKNEL